MLAAEITWHRDIRQMAVWWETAEEDSQTYSIRKYKKGALVLMSVLSDSIAEILLTIFIEFDNPRRA
jgi:hypothetical protein